MDNYNFQIPREAGKDPFHDLGISSNTLLESFPWPSGPTRAHGSEENLPRELSFLGPNFYNTQNQNLDKGPLPTQSAPTTSIPSFTKRKNWSSLIFSAVPDFLFALNSRAEFISCTASIEEITELKVAEDLMGKPFKDFLIPDDKSKWDEEINSLLSVREESKATFWARFRKIKNSEAPLQETNLSQPRSFFDPSKYQIFEIKVKKFPCDSPIFICVARTFPTNALNPGNKILPTFDSFLDAKIENEVLKQRLKKAWQEVDEFGKDSKETNMDIEALSGEVALDAATRDVIQNLTSGDYFSNFSIVPNSDFTFSHPISNIDFSSDALSSFLQQQPPPPDPTQSLFGPSGFNFSINPTDTLLAGNSSNIAVPLPAVPRTSVSDKKKRNEGDDFLGLGNASKGKSKVAKDSLGGSTSAAGGLPPKKKKFKQKMEDGELVCHECGTTESPEWRKGPAGPKSLCNACGLRFAKKNKQTANNTENVGPDPMDINRGL